jgi:hypothetical protein
VSTRLAAALLLAALCAPAVHAQQASVGGRVYDERGAFVSGVTVTARAGGQLLAVVVTDERGLFRLLGTPDAKPYILTFQHPAFESIEVDVTDVDASAQLEVVLRQTSILLPGVRVEEQTTAQRVLLGFEERRAREGALGVFFDAREVRSWRAAGLRGLAAQVPFLTTVRTRFDPVRLKMRTAAGTLCDPSLFIDGFWAADDGNQVFMPSDIQALEVYRFPMRAPEPYGGIAAGADPNCGVVLIWTRHLTDQVSDG